MTDAIMTDPRILALRDFIFDVYPERAKTHRFSTSLTSCSLCTTPEEDLVGAAIEAILPGEDYPDWLREVPALVYRIVDAHATKTSQLANAIEFVQDFVADCIHSNIYENGSNELDDDLKRERDAQRLKDDPDLAYDNAAQLIFQRDGGPVISIGSWTDWSSGDHYVPFARYNRDSDSFSEVNESAILSYYPSVELFMARMRKSPIIAQIA